MSSAVYQSMLEKFTVRTRCNKEKRKMTALYTYTYRQSLAKANSTNLRLDMSYLITSKDC